VAISTTTTTSSANGKGNKDRNPSPSDKDNDDDDDDNNDEHEGGGEFRNYYSAGPKMVIGDSSLEEQYVDDLTRKVAKLLQLKKQGSLLTFGGRHWRFGRLIAKLTDAKTLVYADDNKEALEEAEANEEEEEILTIECDVNDPRQITTLGKYDGILMKEVLERVHDLDTLFGALYKILKLTSRSIFITRLRPCLPLPARIVERWTTAAPEFDVVRTTGERHDFLVEQQTLTYPVKIEKSEWAKILAERSLPFASDLKDAEIDQFIGGLPPGDTIEFEDEIELIALIKEIEDD